MTRNAELQAPAFLKEGTSDWCTVELAWFGKRRQDCVFWGVFLKKVGLNGKNLPFFLICVTTFK